jgi:prepilin-type N-terminal cleavage/methylation domain-containing protein
MRKQQGFTLVEIAIVMVIIGLLLGGVLKGQEIITNAKIKKLENEFNGITAAIYSYQDRYQAFPGDDKRAKMRFGDNVPACSGGGTCGNGKIDDDFNPDDPSNKESGFFWAHLRYAGLVTGVLERDGGTDSDATELPFNAVDGRLGVSHAAVTGLDSLGGTLYIGFTGIPRDIAVTLESQTDDLDPKGGSVLAKKEDNQGNAAAVTTYDDEATYEMYFTL